MQRIIIHFAGICLLVLSTLSAAAQTDSPCISIGDISARCIEPGPDGTWRYAIYFSLNSVHPDADAIYVSSSTGHVGTPLFPLPTTSSTLAFRYASSTSDKKACFTFTVYDMTDEGRHAICRVEKCIELPKCELKCENVHKKLRNTLAVFEGEDAVLKGLISLLPAGVDWFSITIQNARHITVCDNSTNPVWQNLQTDISYAALSGAANPQISNHQVRWNFDSCFKLYDKAFKVVIDLPSFCQNATTNVHCVDTAEICIKYAYKLCDGPRCDTTVCFRLIRRCTNDVGTNSFFGSTSGTTNSQLSEYPTYPSESVSAYPNPASESATIEIFTQSDRPIVNIDIIDVNGTIVSSMNAPLVNGASSLSISTSAFANGIYTLRVNDVPNPLTTTLVVTR